MSYVSDQAVDAMAAAMDQPMTCECHGVLNCPTPVLLGDHCACLIAGGIVTPCWAHLQAEARA